MEFPYSYFSTEYHFTQREKEFDSSEEPRDDVIPSFSHKNVKPFSHSALLHEIEFSMNPYT